MTTIKPKFDGFHPTFEVTKRTYRVTYIVHGNPILAAWPATLEWPPISITDVFARLVGIGDFHQTGNNTGEVELTYSTDPADNAQKKSKKDQPANPLARAPIQRWGTGYLERYPPADLDGAAFCVSTGEPIKGGVPIKTPYLIKGYIRNEPFFNENTCKSMIYAMDSTKKILCAKFDGAEEMIDDKTNISYVQVSYEFWCLDSAGDANWDELRLDAGSYWLGDADSDGKRTPQFLTDKDGTKAYADGAIPLDGSGGQLSQSNINAGTFHWRTFRVNRIANFGSLALPGL